MQTGCCGPRGCSSGPSISSSRIASSRRSARGTLQAGQLHTFGFRSLTLDPALLEAGQIADAFGARHLPGWHALRHSRHDGRAASRCRSPPRPGAGPVLIALPLEPPGGVGFDPAHADADRRALSRADRTGARRRPGRLGPRGDRDRPAAGAAACTRQVGWWLHRPADSRDQGLRADGGVCARRAPSCRRHWRPARWPGTRNCCRK